MSEATTYGVLKSNLLTLTFKEEFDYLSSLCVCFHLNMLIFKKSNIVLGMT